MIFIYLVILYFLFKGMKYVVVNDCDLLIFVIVFVLVFKCLLEICFMCFWCWRVYVWGFYDFFCILYFIVF